MLIREQLEQDLSNNQLAVKMSHEVGPPCECGCGRQAEWIREKRTWSRFYRGHGIKTQGAREKCKESARKRWGDPEIRFWSKVDTSGGPNACWPWKASVDKDGYGYVRWGGKRSQKAHRAAWMILTGEDVPNGQCVLHTCDNPSCCNPKHLWLGTNKANIADKVAKGRQAWGERNGAVLLTGPEVQEIRCLVRGGTSRVFVAKRMGVSKSCVDKIVTGQTWKRL